MKYQIEIKPGAQQDLSYYSSYIQKIIVKAIEKHLQYDANIQTKKRKEFRENPIAAWELRIGEYRVFYEIEGSNKVNVLAIGHKENHVLFIRNEEVKL